MKTLITLLVTALPLCAVAETEQYPHNEVTSVGYAPKTTAPENNLQVFAYQDTGFNIDKAELDEALARTTRENLNLHQSQDTHAIYREKYHGLSYNH